MVEVLHCDRCGVRMPVGHPPGEPCGSCGYVLPAEASVAAPRARQASRPSSRPSSHASSHTSSHATTARHGASDAREPRQLPDFARSNVTIFAVAAVTGALAAVAIGLLLRGGPEAPEPAPIAGPPPVAEPAPRPPPAPAPPASVFRTPLESEPAPVARELSPAPAPAPPKADEDDFFAKLRAESEGRRVQIGEAEAEKRLPIQRRMERAVARWDPDWNIVDAGDDPNLPGINPCVRSGRKNVLVTHPVKRGMPCALERSVDIPASGRTELVVTVAPHDADAVADWVLRALVDGKPIGRRVVGWVNGSPKWQAFRFGLTRFAGRTVKLRLEHMNGGPRNPWNWEFAFWGEARIVTD